MAQVIVLDSINEDIFVCGVCKAVYNSMQVFLEHKNLECGKQMITQEQSTVSTMDLLAEPNILNENMQNEKSSVNTEHEIDSNVLVCSKCKKKFKKMKTLLAHMKTHSEKPFQCLVCGRCFVENSHLQRHIPSHKVWPDSLNETTPRVPEVDLLSYICSYCDVILPNYTQYRSHLKNHWSYKKYKCIQGECMDFHDTIEGLLDHVSVAHDILVYSCHICNSSFSSLEDIATHQRSHNEPTPKSMSKKKHYKCNLCDAVFLKPEKLSLHMLTENHKKTCIHCNKIFASDKRLRQHLQTHKTLKQFQCNICNLSFQLKKYLSVHMLKHGNTQYKCSVCKFMFKRQDSLQRHMKLHQPRKLMKCPFKDTLDCPKKFSRNDTLQLHIKSHMKHVSLDAKTKTKLTDRNVGVCASNSD